MQLTSLLVLLCAGLTAADSVRAADSTSPPDSAFSDQFLTLGFRESPYAPHVGLHRISRQQAATINHYRFDYDAQGRVVAITFALGQTPRRRNHTANYFWYASSERYSYIEGQQHVRYFDEWGKPMSVHGGVARSVYSLDEYGRRTALKYFDAEGKPVESAWGIHRYDWTHLDDGSVTESRYNLEGRPQPLRPGFDFATVRLSYDVSGRTRLMQNLTEDGAVTAGNATFAQDRFTHSAHGELLRYDVLDAHGNAASNHQGISSGLVRYTPQGYEHVSSYLARDGSPARNDYGWWRAVRTYDRFGNLHTNGFEDLEGRPQTNPITGYATAVIDWHEDGLRRRAFRYFGADGQPVAHSGNGYHAAWYRYAPGGFPSEIILTDPKGKLVAHGREGWAVTRFAKSEDDAAPIAIRLTPEEAATTQLDDALETLRELARVPGMAAAIAVDGEVLWHGQAGTVDGAGEQNVEPQTVFRLASVSKAVTSVLAAQAIQAGAIGLQSSSSALLPIEHDATLGQLLAHTGSVGHYRGGERPDREGTYDTSLEALPVALSHVLDVPTGQRYVYSTFGYTLAGAMLETATGTPLPEQVAQLATTAGTPTLAAPIDESRVPNLTEFFEITTSGPVPARERNFSYAFAGAGMVASAGDLARLMSLFAAGKIVEPAVRDLMFESARLNGGEAVRDRRYEVAMGWRRQRAPDGRTWYFHAGATDGARSVVAVDPDRGLAVALLSNAGWTSDVFGTAVALDGIFRAPDAAGELSSPTHIANQGEVIPMVFDRCSGASCAWAGENTGVLGQWLNRDGRGSRVELHESAGSRYLVTPYGLSYFFGDTAMIGSRAVTLKGEPGSPTMAEVLHH